MSYSGSFRQTGPFYTAEGAAFATSASLAQTGLCEAATGAAETGEAERVSAENIRAGFYEGFNTQLEDINKQISIGKSNGIDDTATINIALESKGYIRGMQGEIYIISSPLVIGSKTWLDMRGCTVLWRPNVIGNNLIQNSSIRSIRSVSDANMDLGATTLFSLTANFTGTDIGRSVCVLGAGGTISGPVVLTADILSVTDSNTVVLSLPAKNTVSNATARVYNRDSDIHIIGGIWDRGANKTISEDAELNLNGLHGLSFRHVDFMSIDIESYLSTEPGAKYAILLGDVTCASVSVSHLDTISDGVHLIGPCSNIDIPYLAGKTGDDFISLTGADYPHYSDTSGDIIGVHVGVALMDNARAGYKILPGSGNLLDKFKADYSAGTAESYAVAIASDISYPDTKGGVCGDIDLGYMGVVSTSDMLRVFGMAVKRLQLSVKGGARYQYCRVLDNLDGTSGNIGMLIINDALIADGRTLFLKEGISTVDNVVINNPIIRGTGTLAQLAGGVIGKMTINNFDAVYSGESAPILVNGASVGEVNFNEPKADLSGAQDVGALVKRISGTGISKLSIVRGSVIFAGPTKGYVAYCISTGISTIIVDNADIVNCRRIADYFYGGNVVLIQARIEAALELIHAVSGGVTVTGSIAKLTTATNVISAGSVGARRVNGDTLPVDVSLLTPITGDTVRNVSVTAGAGWYVGVVRYDGTKWTPSTGYVLKSTITLSAGTFAVANTRITSTSVIRLYHQYSNSGTAGAGWVDSMAAGTGFVRKSTSPTDTSAITYEIVVY